VNFCALLGLSLGVLLCASPAPASAPPDAAAIAPTPATPSTPATPGNTAAGAAPAASPSAPAAAPPAAPPPAEPILQPHQPITAGYTHDSDDAPYLDVTLSAKVRLLPLNWTGTRNRLFLAMSTRFGFYWGTRPGSPVIGKSYNPELFWRFLTNPHSLSASSGSPTGRFGDYIDLGYAHESNGQVVHTPQQYQEELALLHDLQYTDNFIHRGWDYVELNWRQLHAYDIATLFQGKYFMPDGLLQGQPDEYHAWEDNPQGKPRREVDGLSMQVEYPSASVRIPVNTSVIVSRPNLTLRYATGDSQPFRYSTVRAEFGFQLLSLPLAIWAQRGYMSDLAMYYLRVQSYGIELRFESF
jgi:hypothetical protein